MTPYGTLEELERDWNSCKRCPLGWYARKHVLYEVIDVCEGKLTQPDLSGSSEYCVEVMIVGEAPGVGEDVLGRPFIGPAGQLLRKAIQQATPHSGLTFCLTNLLACRPFKGDSRNPANRAPEAQEIMACQTRLEGLMYLLQPQLIIAAGNVPDEWLTGMMFEFDYTCKFQKVRHPAWVVRQNPQYPAFMEYVKSLDDAFNELYKLPLGSRRKRKGA